MEINVRTDLASEAHSIWQSTAQENTKLSVVIARQEQLCSLNVTSVEITNDEGSRALGKACGKYFTLELAGHFDSGSDCLWNQPCFA